MRRSMHAFLAIWHDIDPAMEDEWHRWHTHEHMPERIGIPGFLAGRRYMRRDIGSADAARQLPRCFTMYEGAELAVFSSDAYLERLNAPTRWTREMSPAFQNFARGACDLRISSGDGYGGSVMTMRFDHGAGDADISPGAFDALDRLVMTLASLDGITGAHFGVCAPQVTETETSERKARSASGEQAFQSVLIVEAYDGARLHEQVSALEANLDALGLPASEAPRAIYDLAFLLTERTTEEPNRH